MDPQKIYISSDRKSKIFAWIFIAVLFLIYYSIMAMLAPIYKMREFKSNYAFNLDMNNPVNEKILIDSTYLALIREKAFLQSRVLMAKTDSIYLSVNLADSTVNLEISGVVVLKTDIRKISVSKILQGGNDYIILSMLSNPLTINRDFASIEKEPLMLKMAPKDTSEYVPDIIPDTSDYEPVNIILETDNGIRFHIYQDDKLKPGDGVRRSLFDIYHRLRYSAKTFIKVITFKVPEYQPYIKIRIPRSDAKIIYRALPEKGQIALSR